MPRQDSTSQARTCLLAMSVAIAVDGGVKM
jgi:hypothetical protein